MPLTDKQEAFCREYVLNLGNASAAYRIAYEAENMGAASIHQCAYELKQNPEIALRIEELRQETLEGYVISREYLTKELIEIVDCSKKLKIEGEGSNTKIQLPDPELRRKTLMDLGKLHGHITDKKEIKIDDSDLLKRIKDAK